MTYILSLSDPSATLETVGGKGASLARLAQAGLPVPGGFHITTAAYRQFVAANDLQPRLLAALATADITQPASLEAASTAIRSLFSQARLPADLASAITQAYATFSPADAHLPIAVRSSATAEDLPDLSFAGQQDTFLNIRGADALLDAVQCCWASLWTARAIGYRLQHHIDQAAVSLAVVVQQLVLADAAGVLFTAHPVSGRRDQALLTATWGLGEAIVGGLVTPDTLTLDKASGRVLSRETAEKLVMTVRLEHGTEEQPVPEAQRRAPVLSDPQAVELMQLGVRIEQHYGRPMDIEWTLAAGEYAGGESAGSHFAIVQARPITALPEPEISIPAEWLRPDPKAQCFRGSITEQLPDPLTPLFGTLGLKIISAGSARLFNGLFGKGTVSEDMLATINGYAYYQMRLSPHLLVGMINAIVTFWPEFKRSEQRWREDAHVRYVAAIERWRSRPAAALGAAEILEATRQLTAEMVYTYNVLQSGVLGLAGGVEVLFTSIYNRLIKRPNDPKATTFLLGFDSFPIQAEKSLYDLAQQARTCLALSEYLAGAPAAQVARQLASAETPPGVPAEAWEAWQRGFATHLAQYGHVLYNLDFATPVSADNPDPLLETCQMYLHGQGVDPHERQQGLADRREQAARSLLSRLKGWRLKLFRKTLAWAYTFVPLREDCLADLGLGYPLLRQFLRDLGRRLTQAGMLAQPEEVYWLTEDEALRAATALDQGEPLASAAEAVRQRKAVWHAQKKLTPPMALPERSRFNRYVEQISPARMDQAAGNLLKGTGASQGCVTGKARVLHGPEDFGQMQAGEVLVAAITTPAWTPLFARAAAIVTDVGGPLSHGSIVAREYGIPAVLGTGVATKRIQSGQTITVDGTAGTVTLISLN
jgi:rifampicin phosphotransferase